MTLTGVQKLRYSLYGVGFIVFIVAVCVLAVLEFNRDFDSSDPLVVKAPRAGLLLTAGSQVKMRGVTIGHVGAVHTSPDGAVIDLAISPGEMHLIPADVGAHIVPPTVFGAKYVELIAPASSSRAANDGDGPARTIAAGATIDASHVTVEINNTFQHLLALLQATQPAKVNAALTALATSLDGRGNELGQLLTKLDTYLRQINPALGTLKTDLPRAKSVLGTYSRAAPDLLKTARNVTRTSDAIENNKASLDAFLLSLTSVSNHTSDFLTNNSDTLMTALNVLKTPLVTLARYSPEYPCFFKGLADTALPVAASAIGGYKPGLNLLTQFLPPEAPYTYPKDLPVVRADNGPHCYGLPKIPLNAKFRTTKFDTGVTPYKGESAPGVGLPLLLKILFGSLSGVSS